MENNEVVNQNVDRNSKQEVIEARQCLERILEALNLLLNFSTEGNTLNTIKSLIVDGSFQTRKDKEIIKFFDDNVKPVLTEELGTDESPGNMKLTNLGQRLRYTLHFIDNRFLSEDRKVERSAIDASMFTIEAVIATLKDLEVSLD